MEPTEFLKTFQNYASCNWSYLLLNFGTEYHNFSTKILWFVPFLSNFSRCHSFSFKKQRDLDLVSVWECQLVLVFILNYHSKWFSNRWNGKTEEKSGVVAGSTFFYLLYGTPLSGHYFLSSHIWTDFKNKWVNRWAAFYSLFKTCLYLKMLLEHKV